MSQPPKKANAAPPQPSIVIEEYTSTTWGEPDHGGNPLALKKSAIDKSLQATRMSVSWSELELNGVDKEKYYKNIFNANDPMAAIFDPDQNGSIEAVQLRKLAAYIKKHDSSTISEKPGAWEKITKDGNVDLKEMFDYVKAKGDTAEIAREMQVTVPLNLPIKSKGHILDK